MTFHTCREKSGYVCDTTETSLQEYARVRPVTGIRGCTLHTRECFSLRLEFVSTQLVRLIDVIDGSPTSRTTLKSLQPTHYHVEAQRSHILRLVPYVRRRRIHQVLSLQRRVLLLQGAYRQRESLSHRIMDASRAYLRLARTGNAISDSAYPQRASKHVPSRSTPSSSLSTKTCLASSRYHAR